MIAQKPLEWMQPRQKLRQVFESTSLLRNDISIVVSLSAVYFVLMLGLESLYVFTGETQIAEKVDGLSCIAKDTYSSPRATGLSTRRYGIPKRTAVDRSTGRGHTTDASPSTLNHDFVMQPQRRTKFMVKQLCGRNPK